MRRIEPIVPDELLLAGLRRAERHHVDHDGVPRRGVPFWVILGHIAIPRRTKSARAVRARLEAFEALGVVEKTTRNGVKVWLLTTKGKRRVRSTGPTALPESPQHQEWRSARIAAADAIEIFRETF